MSAQQGGGWQGKREPVLSILPSAEILVHGLVMKVGRRTWLFVSETQSLIFARLLIKEDY